MEIYMRSNRGKYDAQGAYNDGKVIVYKGSRINVYYSENFKRHASAEAYRKDPSCVDKNGNVLKDCVFTSLSAAAQFVCGWSVNGRVTWKVDKKTDMRHWLVREANKE